MCLRSNYVCCRCVGIYLSSVPYSTFDIGHHRWMWTTDIPANQWHQYSHVLQRQHHTNIWLQQTADIYFSILPASANFAFTAVWLYFVLRVGRSKLLIVSLFGIVFWFVVHVILPGQPAQPLSCAIARWNKV